MSKMIDVMDGDKFTICPDGTVFQYRDGKCRSVNAHRVSNWWPDDLINDEYEITERAAKKFFDWWGYTLTPAAKPKANGNCQQESKPETLTQPKPADVPVVDAVWVEWTDSLGRKYMLGHADESSAREANQSDFAEGTARIVRIRSVDEEARESAANARQIADNVSDRVDELLERVKNIESRLAEKPADGSGPTAIDVVRKGVTLLSATIEATRADVNRLESRLAALEKPANKPAARVVKAPTEEGIHTPAWWGGWKAADAAWRKWLSVKNIPIVDELEAAE